MSIECLPPGANYDPNAPFNEIDYDIEELEDDEIEDDETRLDIFFMLKSGQIKNFSFPVSFEIDEIEFIDLHFDDQYICVNAEKNRVS